MSPILGQEKGPEDQKDPGTGAQSSSILADLPPSSPGVPLPGKADDKCIGCASKFCLKIGIGLIPLIFLGRLFQLFGVLKEKLFL